MTSYLFITVDTYEKWHENKFKCHFGTVRSFIQTLKFLVLNRISAVPITKVMSITLQGSDIWVDQVKFKSLYFIRIIFLSRTLFVFFNKLRTFHVFYTAPIKIITIFTHYGLLSTKAVLSIPILFRKENQYIRLFKSINRLSNLNQKK